MSEKQNADTLPFNEAVAAAQDLLARCEAAVGKEHGKPRVYVSGKNLLALRAVMAVIDHLQNGHFPVRLLQPGEVYRLADVLCTLDSGETMLVDWSCVNFLREARREKD